MLCPKVSISFEQYIWLAGSYSHGPCSLSLSTSLGGKKTNNGEEPLCGGGSRKVKNGSMTEMKTLQHGENPKCFLLYKPAGALLGFTSPGERGQCVTPHAVGGETI